MDDFGIGILKGSARNVFGVRSNLGVGRIISLPGAQISCSCTSGMVSPLILVGCRFMHAPFLGHISIESPPPHAFSYSPV